MCKKFLEQLEPNKPVISGADSFGTLETQTGRPRGEWIQTDRQTNRQRGK